jgi:beta-mannan synthase
VLDDSTDSVTRELVDEKVLEWRERGIAVDCMRRTNRQGYKAGAMKEVRAGAGRRAHRVLA